MNRTSLLSRLSRSGLSFSGFSFAAIPFAVAVLATPAPAAAAEIALSPAGVGSFTQQASGMVLDDFSFAPTAFDTTFSVTLSSLSGPVTFFNAVFFPDTAAEIDFSNLTNDVGGNFSFAAPVTSAMPLTLRVFGAAMDATGTLVDGSYNVAVTAAVPEPGTYALLLAGLLGVGIASRRRAG